MTDDYKFPALTPEVFEATAKEIKAMQKESAAQITNVVEPTGNEE